MLGKFLGTIYGLAIGDALGRPYESSNYEYMKAIPNEEILNLKRLKITDDTTMALCIMRSIVKKGILDPEDIANEYLKEYLAGGFYGIGLTVNRALLKFQETKDWRTCGVRSYWAAGNGVAMRIAPIALYDAFTDYEELYEHVRNDGWITHKNELAISGAFAIALGINRALFKKDKESILEEVLETLKSFGIVNPVLDNIQKAQKLYEEKVSPMTAYLNLGVSGYVVHTVSSAFYTFLKFDTYIDGILSIIRAGDDTDTNAAVAGALLGAFYGMEIIPDYLIERLEVNNEIDSLTKKLYLIAERRKKK